MIVQLPFPSTRDPDEKLAAYYSDYDRLFRAAFPEYFIPQDGLWEMPLWVAHLTSLVRTAGLESQFCDLSKAPAETGTCFEQIHDTTAPGDLVLMSPLAQNFRLTLEVARLLEQAGRRVVLGGNMAPLADVGDVHLVHRGQLDAVLVGKLVQLADSGGELEKKVRRGKSDESISWAPDYRHLDGFRGQIPLLRLNASHGCLYQCSFCGDAWSQQLVMVDKNALSTEVDELAHRFPDTRLFYIGDKTFGQSKDAVRNLIEVFRDRAGYRFIVQTHVMQVRPWVIEAMHELGVVTVELGFESGDSQMLKRLNKLSRGLDDYTEKVRMLADSGLNVVLNVMGGLDEETEESHRQTVAWLYDNRSMLWLFNLYSFVPYPLVPDFAMLKDRIYNWDFADWREDALPVFQPKNMPPERSWELFMEKVDAAHDIVRAKVDQLALTPHAETNG
ncbi:hypothetical protein ASJ30_14490 [Janibacter indicus]|uniref:Radical SAM core domain-containing protein n=1 Tax=Janibacter indicus TaxID=857417 RepID=A0A1L3MJT6_9MICO|nr:radical SAM protein [Janibacter indicus]APH02592.1 hypothetical protein ASJ30_14490 [Janibacter indicus]